MGSSLNKIKRGKLVGDGSVRKVVCGFAPKYVKWENVTDRIGLEKMELMDAKKALKTVAAGTRTYVDSLTLDSDGFTVEAAEFVAAKEYHYVAFESKSE